MTCQSWEEYKQIIFYFFKQKHHIYFRGQRDSTWPLKTTFLRYSEINGITLAFYDEVIIPQLINPVGDKYGKKFDAKNPQEYASFLSLLQHYSFPTPLLDWTLCPYIAAYFAFKNPAEYVKVFVFDAESWHQPRHALPVRQVQSPYVHVTAVEPYNAGNPRVIAQKGKFTLTNAPNLEEYIRDHPANIFIQESESFIQSITMPRTEKIKAMRDLNLLGINERSLCLNRDGEFTVLADACKELSDCYFPVVKKRKRTS